MEKKYLIVSSNGKEFGAFENITNMKTKGLKKIAFDCDDGHLVYWKNKKGKYVACKSDIVFDDYKLVCRRTFKRHAGLV